MRTIVAVARCQSYSDGVQQAVEKLLHELGGLEQFVQSGQSVLIKPNLLRDASPAQAVTTHPEVVRALIRLIKTRGAKPAVADSPTSVLKIEQVWERTGFRSMCEEENVPLINLEKAGSKQFRAGNTSFSVAQPVLDADVLISVPKVKTHLLTVFTAAVKNMYGTIPGFQKTILHKLYPKPEQFGEFLAELYGIVKPKFAIADAVVAMEGNGPSGGDPVNLGFLAGSADAVALDVTLCHLLGIDARKVPYFQRLHDADMGETDWEKIEVVGDEQPKLSHLFRVPGIWPGRFIPRWLINALGSYVWIRPFMNERCVYCGHCVSACPTGALSIEKGHKPILNRKKCIGCCCCHEICAERAIEMTQSLLLSLFHGGKLPQ